MTRTKQYSKLDSWGRNWQDQSSSKESTGKSGKKTNKKSRTVTETTKSVKTTGRKGKTTFKKLSNNKTKPCNLTKPRECEWRGNKRVPCLCY